MYACFFLIFTDGCQIWMETPPLKILQVWEELN